MEVQGRSAPLPFAVFSLHAFAPNSIAVKRPTLQTKAVVPSSSITLCDGPRSHPIEAVLSSDVVDSDRSAQAKLQTKPHALTRLIAAIPGAFTRLVSGPSSLTTFLHGPTRLSDIRLFPSPVPQGGARGGSALPGGGAARKASVVWFRNDLRLHDNPSLDRACRESTSILPVYVFDTRDYDKLSSGYGRTGPARAQFILEAVADLRQRLRHEGSDLVVRVGRPEKVLKDLAAAVGAGAVYCQAEAAEEEVQVEGRVRAALDAAGCDMRIQWGGTLYHLEDLPFSLSALPISYAEFRTRVEGLLVRPLVASERGIKGLPQASEVEPGELPLLQQLGLTAPPPRTGPAATITGGFDSPAVSAAARGLTGGETEALRHLQTFMNELKANLACKATQQPTRRSSPQTASSYPSSSYPSSSFSCRISPWLALGCLSPRRMYFELRQLGRREPLRALKPQIVQQRRDQGEVGAGGASPAHWLVFELLWRDYFRFVAQKYSSRSLSATATAAKQNAAPVGVVAADGVPRVARSASAAHSALALAAV